MLAAAEADTAPSFALAVIATAYTARIALREEIGIDVPPVTRTVRDRRDDDDCRTANFRKASAYRGGVAPVSVAAIPRVARPSRC